MMKLLNNPRGSVIVMWALLLPTFLALAGLVVDIGAIYAERTRLQHVADAAALAGASMLSDDAKAIALSNAYIGKNNVTNTENTIKVNHNKQYSYTDKSGNNKTKTVTAIEVDIAANSPTYFARIINISSIAIAVHATAIGPTEPNPFNYAIVNAGEQDFTLFGGGAQGDNRYNGSVWANGDVRITDSGHTVDSGRLGGSFITASPNQPSDINQNPDWKSKVVTDAEKIKIDQKGENKNSYIEDFIKTNKNTSNIYSDSHPCRVYGAIDFTKLGGNGSIYAPGDFKGSAITSGNTFQKAEKIIIVAEGDINLTDAVVTNPNAEIILCSLTGNIKFDGRIENFPNVIMIAPRGKIDMVCSITHMRGSLISQDVRVGNAGNLQIRNDGSGGDDNMNRIRLIE